VSGDDPDVRLGVYEHYHGGRYLVLGVGRWHSHDESDGRRVVLYVRLYPHDEGGPPINVRPLDEFLATYDEAGGVKPKFRYLGLDDPPA
jgi:hypothetical protein